MNPGAKPNPCRFTQAMVEGVMRQVEVWRLNSACGPRAPADQAEPAFADFATEASYQGDQGRAVAALGSVFSHRLFPRTATHFGPMR